MTTLKRPTVAGYLSEKINASGKTAEEIASAIGHDNTDLIQAFISGNVKVPANLILPLARVLEVDPVYLLRLVLSEYMPDMLTAIDDCVPAALLTKSELGLVEAYRETSNGADAVAVEVKTMRLRA
jgi:plasmid maintenance system antidote protein VapI